MAPPLLGSAMNQLLLALSFHCGALGAYGINPPAGVRFVVLLKTPVPDNSGGSGPVESVGIFKTAETVPRLVKPYDCPLPALTVMLTGAEVLTKPLLLTATALSE